MYFLVFYAYETLNVNIIISANSLRHAGVCLMTLALVGEKRDCVAR